MNTSVTPTSLADALHTWAALQGVGKKDSTRAYHQEIVGIVTTHWPGKCEDVAAVTERTLTEFILIVAKHYSPSCYNGILTAIHGLFPETRKKYKRQRVRSKERTLLSPEQFTQLVEELDRAPRSHGGLVIRFLAHTGMRIGESRKLRWSDVLTDRIVVPGSITKNGLPRTIPFIDGVEVTLDALRLVGDGVHVLPQAEVQTSLRSACVRLKLHRVSHHDFRHLFATRCVASEADLPTVARWLGHLDGGALLARLYFHLVDHHSFKMAARVRITPLAEVSAARGVTRFQLN